jgi:hypothetical protein
MHILSLAPPNQNPDYEQAGADQEVGARFRRQIYRTVTFMTIDRDLAYREHCGQRHYVLSMRRTPFAETVVVVLSFEYDCTGTFRGAHLSAIPMQMRTTPRERSTVGDLRIHGSHTAIASGRLNRQRYRKMMPGRHSISQENSKQMLLCGWVGRIPNEPGSSEPLISCSCEAEYSLGFGMSRHSRWQKAADCGEFAKLLHS